jgi:hypothetical protein
VVIVSDAGSFPLADIVSPLPGDPLDHRPWSLGDVRVHNR